MPVITAFPITTTPLPTTPLSGLGATIITAINTTLGSTAWQASVVSAAYSTETGVVTLTKSDGSTVTVTIPRPANAAPPAATSAVGSVGTTTYEYAREDHRHPAQGVSADASNALTVGTDGLHYLSTAVAADEVIENAGALAGAVPVGAQWGVDTTTGQAYYNSGGVWAAVPVAAVDLNTTASNQSASLAGAAPLAAPGAPDAGDVHVEVYSDKTIWWTWGGAAWVNSAEMSATGLDEVVVNAGALAGAAPAGAKWGIDTTTGQTYYVVAGVWTPHSPVITPANAIPPAANDAVGSIGTTTSEFALEDHKHPAQAPSTDVGNQITVGADGLHFLDNMTGATALVAGTAGTVPAPAAGDEGKFLRGDGTWQPAGSVYDTWTVTAVPGYQASVGEVVAVDNTLGPITINAPLAPQIGDVFTFGDGLRQASAGKPIYCDFAPSGELFEGLSNIQLAITRTGAALQMIYMGGTVGWMQHGY